MRTTNNTYKNRFKHINGINKNTRDQNNINSVLKISIDV